MKFPSMDRQTIGLGTTLQASKTVTPSNSNSETETLQTRWRQKHQTCGGESEPRPADTMAQGLGYNIRFIGYILGLYRDSGEKMETTCRVEDPKP